MPYETRSQTLSLASSSALYIVAVAKGLSSKYYPLYLPLLNGMGFMSHHSIPYKEGRLLLPFQVEFIRTTFNKSPFLT